MNRDDIIRMYEKANGWSPEGWDKTVDELERFANLVAAAEREACAKICDEKAKEWPEMRGWLDDFSNEIAAAIRERGAP